MAKFYIICHVTSCHDMTIFCDKSLTSEFLIYHCMKQVEYKWPINLVC